MKRPLRALAKDDKGAVLVEFIAAFMPILGVFLCLAQAVGLYAAKLVSVHAATLGARAAVVVIPDNPKYYGGSPKLTLEGKRLEDVERATLMGLAINQSISLAGAEITVGDPETKAAKTNFERDETVGVWVDAPYRCGLPIAQYIVCGMDGVLVLESRAALRIHGADYEYP